MESSTLFCSPNPLNTYYDNRVDTFDKMLLAEFSFPLYRGSETLKHIDE